MVNPPRNRAHNVTYVRNVKPRSLGKLAYPRPKKNSGSTEICAPLFPVMIEYAPLRHQRRFAIASRNLVQCWLREIQIRTEPAGVITRTLQPTCVTNGTIEEGSEVGSCA